MIIDSFTGEYEWLSNFYPVEVTLDGQKYPSVEHAYQAAKTTDLAWRDKIREAKSSAAAKRLGRKVPLKPDWEEIKITVMSELLAEKFMKEPFYSLLKGTKDAHLVEGNYWGDYFWGVCDGLGKNMLGKLLMSTREALL